MSALRDRGGAIPIGLVVCTVVKVEPSATFGWCLTFRCDDARWPGREIKLCTTWPPFDQARALALGVDSLHQSLGKQARCILDAYRGADGALASYIAPGISRHCTTELRAYVAGCPPELADEMRKSCGILPMQDQPTLGVYR